MDKQGDQTVVKRSKAFQEGFEAFGQSVQSNGVFMPHRYFAGSAKFDAWSFGWITAEMQHRTVVKPVLLRLEA